MLFFWLWQTFATFCNSTSTSTWKQVYAWIAHPSPPHPSIIQDPKIRGKYHWIPRACHFPRWHRRRAEGRQMVCGLHRGVLIDATPYDSGIQRSQVSSGWDVFAFLHIKKLFHKKKIRCRSDCKTLLQFSSRKMEQHLSSQMHTMACVLRDLDTLAKA